MISVLCCVIVNFCFELVVWGVLDFLFDVWWYFVFMWVVVDVLLLFLEWVVEWCLWWFGCVCFGLCLCIVLFVTVWVVGLVVWFFYVFVAQWFYGFYGFCVWFGLLVILVGCWIVFCVCVDGFFGCLDWYWLLGNERVFDELALGIVCGCGCGICWIWILVGLVLCCGGFGFLWVWCLVVLWD